jgi:hypothetical protein
MPPAGLYSRRFSCQLGKMSAVYPGPREPEIPSLTSARSGRSGALGRSCKRELANLNRLSEGPNAKGLPPVHCWAETRGALEHDGVHGVEEDTALAANRHVRRTCAEMRGQRKRCTSRDVATKPFFGSGQRLTARAADAAA